MANRPTGASEGTARGPDSPGDQFNRLCAIMATLRGPDGCPWDREQTIDSLKRYVLEETYEVLEAIDRGDHDALCEELGDFLFEAVFLAQLESEAGRFTIADAVRAVADKLVRRHPHVFRRAEGEPALTSAGEVKVRWEEIKAQERGGDAASSALLDGVPDALPALHRAAQLGARAAGVGFDWTHAADVMTKIREEVDELGAVVATHGSAGAEPDRRDEHARVEEEMGDLLFAMANLSRKLGVDAETALRKANRKFTTRFTRMERAIADAGRALSELTLDELEEEWGRVKKLELRSEK
jgi:MazG family protein